MAFIKGALNKALYLNSSFLYQALFFESKLSVSITMLQFHMYYIFGIPKAIAHV